MRDIYECEECEISWEYFERSIKEKPKKQKCPKCKKLCETVIATPYIVFKGGGWDTTKSQYEKFQKKGMDKDTANEFLENEIKYSKERMKKGGYKIFTPNIKNMEKKGLVKKVSDKKAQEKLETSRKLTEDAYNKMGVKPGWRDE